jgi:formamidopyrimidine-DNA glycosylase
MPELPEVETVVRQLQAALPGTRIQKVVIHHPGRELPRGVDFIRALEGQTVRVIRRRAKLILWEFEAGLMMIGHLKMTGRFVFVDPETPVHKHERISLVFEGGQEVRFADMRKFGYLRIHSEEEVAKILGGYGPEPLETSTTDLADRLRTPVGRSIKGALLNQTVLAGCGNIYADEACFRAGVLPTRKLGELSEGERRRVIEELKGILQESIDKRGTSESDYVDTKGEKGSFQNFLQVYGRGKKPCFKCGQLIQKIVHVGRGTHFCGHCQK